MNRFVLDASITLAWFIDPSIAPLAQRVQRLLLKGDRAVVPHLWRLEVANGFVIAQRRGVLREAWIAQAFSELEILQAQSMDEVPHEFSIERVVLVAQRFSLTAYDATYLETARQLQLPLATLDRRLAAAAVHAGVSLLD